ncbi:MAG: hypothetical protein MUE94_06750 [Verrucomicrobia bacterium]|jgi:hypothetical protein|nr:hypothetical protein [Verrucomicrobiota bacterium]
MHANLSALARDLGAFFTETLQARRAPRGSRREEGPEPNLGSDSRPGRAALRQGQGHRGHESPTETQNAPVHPSRSPAPGGSFLTPAPAEESRFNHLAQQLFALQFALNPPYRALCLARGVTPHRVSDWQEIPAVPASAFKEFAFTCLPESERTIRFESSGTTQSVRSQGHHSRESLRLYEASLLPWFQHHLLPETLQADNADPGHWDFISLTPPLAQAPRSSLVHMLDAIQRQPWFSQAGFVGRTGPDGTWSLDLGALEAAIQQAHTRSQAVTLAGTAFNWVHLLENPDVDRLRLPQASRLMETGGYKGRSRELSRDQLHKELSARLGVARENIVTEYGMCELSSQAYDQVAGGRCPQRVLRFPPWARVTVVSPETGLEVANGESGLVRVLDLANAFSVMAVETEDLAIRHPDGIELLGRNRQTEPRGCSLLSA